MSVECCHCGDIAKKPIICSSCDEFACDKCVIEKNSINTCVKCFLKASTVAERKMWTGILKKKGIIKERVEEILNYLDSPVMEFTYTRIGDKKSCTIKTAGEKGIEYNKVSDEVFTKFWEKARRLGFEPKRIPLGERIIIKKS